MPDPGTWFLPFDATGGEGRPWGDGTAMAARAGQSDPWDTPCEVTTLIGGFAGMTAIRDALEQTIADAQASGNAKGQCGHVYFAGWRFNAQRDLSDSNGPWPPTPPVQTDQTALGLVVRLMQAGVRVRILVWLPTWVQAAVIDLWPHVADHFYAARVVAAESDHWGLADPLGVVALDARTAEGTIAGAHHQKTIVIRGLGTNHVAFCGGVDLAFTRRDALGGQAAQVHFLGGDWQSGNTIPGWPTTPWPRDGTTDYARVATVALPTQTQPSDLPATEDLTGKPIYGDTNHVWHDQHLMLRGPIVRTLEQQFAERWRDTGRVFDLSDPKHFFGGQVIFSSPAAIDANGSIVDLPDTQPAAAPAGAASPVQMWRTIPWRDARTGPPFQRAEFTVMAGISRAIEQCQELIWIFDQYFWSLPLARQLNNELKDKPSLRVIVVLPPYADTQQPVAHAARARVLDALSEGVRPRVGVYDLWDPRSTGRGIYVHAKAQTYDGGLLVCGSANMNRRSFLCDSELACAVADEAVVLSHQQRLWTLLFGDAAKPFPAVASLDDAGSGAAFFSAFASAAADRAAFVRSDPWKAADPALVNGVKLPRARSDFQVDHFLDPTSVDPALIEGLVDEGAPSFGRRPPRLDEVVRRLEATAARGGDVRMPNRRQSSELRLPVWERDPNGAA